MLLQSQLKSFFELHNIQLQSELVLGEEIINHVFMNALEHGKAFGAFVLGTVVNSERNGIRTNFQSWDDLYVMYCHFMTGFLIAKDGKSN